MTLRRVLNLAENHLLRDFQGPQRETIESSLYELFDYELTEAERKRAERRRLAMKTGAYQSQTELISAFQLPGSRRR